MQDLKKILRKRFQGESQRTIALSLHVSRNNVSKVFKAADSTQLTWVQFQTMEEPELLELLFPTEKRAAVQVVPDFDYVHKALCKRGTSLRGLWKEYALNAQAASLPYYQRSRFSDLYHEYVHKHNLTMEVVDPLTVEKATAYLFVATLPFSMLSYVEACPTMKTNDWIKCHIHMFDYFKGVSRILVSDNLKTGVIRNRKYEDPTLNKTYHEMADHYDISILPTRVRKPKDKAAVEGSVGTVTQFLIDKLHKRKFFSFDEANDAIAKQLELFNHKPFQKREGSRWSCYLEEEYEFMQKLPAQPFELSAWKKLTVQLNYHITIDHMNYSVPCLLYSKSGPFIHPIAVENWSTIFV